jgi:hypothetical protein
MTANGVTAMKYRGNHQCSEESGINQRQWRRKPSWRNGAGVAVGENNLNRGVWRRAAAKAARISGGSGGEEKYRLKAGGETAAAALAKKRGENGENKAKSPRKYRRT